MSNRLVWSLLGIAFLLLQAPVSLAGCTQDGVQCDPVSTSADGTWQTKAFDLDFSTQNQPLLFPGLAPAIEIFDIDLVKRNDLAFDTGNVGFDEIHRFCLDDYINDYFGSTVAAAFRAVTDNVCYSFGGKVSGYVRGGMWSKIGVRARTGDVDVSYPVSVTIQAPDVDAYNPGDVVELQTSFQPRNGVAVDTYFPNWEIKFAMGGDAEGYGTAEGCIDNCESYELLDFSNSGGGEVWVPPYLVLDDTFAPNAAGIFGFLLATYGHIAMPVLQPNPATFSGNKVKVVSEDNFISINVKAEEWLLRFLKIGKAKTLVKGFQSSGSINLKPIQALVKVNSTLQQTSEFEPQFRMNVDFGRALNWEEVDLNGSVVNAGFSQQMEMQVGNKLRLLTDSQDTQAIGINATAFQVNGFQASALLINERAMDYKIWQVAIDTPSWTIFNERCFSFPLLGKLCLPRLGWNAITYNDGPVLDGINHGHIQINVPLFTTPVRELGGFQQFPLQSVALDPNLAPQIASNLGDQYLHWGQNVDLDLAPFFTDPDGQTLNISVSGLPSFLSLNANGRVQGQVDQPFTGTIEVVADDGHGRQVAQTAQLIVAMPLVDTGDGLSVSESGTTDSFQVSLSAQPQTSVQVDVIPQNNEVDLGAGVGVPVSLTFTAANWDQPQQVNIAAFDDLIQEGLPELSTDFVFSSFSNEAGFNAMTAPPFQTAVVDNDVAGVIASPATGSVFSENPAGGTTGVYGIQLTSEPTANVTIDLSCRFSPCVATYSPNQLVFTPLNWNVAQTVTAQGVDNNLADGSHDFYLDYQSPTSADGFYNNLWASNQGGSQFIVAVVSDDDTAGVAISPAVDIVTGEDGTTATISVVLTSQPVCGGGGGLSSKEEDKIVVVGQCPVTVSLSSSNVAEGVFAGLGSVDLVFDELTWDLPQTVILSGVNDDLDDGNQAYTIITDIAATGETTGYGTTVTSVTIPDLNASNLDDDESNLQVVALTAEETAEGGSTAQYSVALTAEPTSNITVAVTSQSTDEGQPTQSSLSFTAANWNVAQNLAIQGVDDAIVDGVQNYAVQLSASGDTQYNQLQPLTVSLSNQDNDVPGVQMIAVGTENIGEAGGSVDYQVALDKQPQTNVTLMFESSDTSEVVVSQASLLFTPVNWASAQVLTVTAVDDPDHDGNQPVSIRVLPIDPSVPGFGGFDPADPVVTVVDDDVPAITVTPVAGGQVTEPDGLASFEIALATRPKDQVQIAVNSSDTTLGSIVGSGVVVFDPASWDQLRTVSVRAVDDVKADGNKSFTVVTANATSTGDADYNNMNVSDVNFTRIDDDVADILVSPVTGLSTAEDGTSTVFGISLASMPLNPVTVGLNLSDTSEATLSASSVQILPADWDQPHQVTVTGRDELLVDGDQTYQVITSAASSSDAAYAGLNPQDVELINLDDDSAGLVISATNLQTSETGTSANFTVKLAARPLGQVKISLRVGDATEGRVSVSELLFDGTDWNSAKTATVTGVNDIEDDGDQTYQLGVNVAADSTDEAFKKVHGNVIDVLNKDDGDLRIKIEPITNLITNESGSQARFSVRLDRAPAQGKQVVVSFASSDVGEGLVSPVSMTITDANWNEPHQVTLTGVNDNADDGDQPWSVVIAPVVSSDLHFAGVDPQDVFAINEDDDIDTDGDGVIDLLEGDTDRDGDTLVDKLDYDPTGYFFDSATGNIVPGGKVSVRCDRGTVSFVSGRNGSNGYYQYLVTGLGANDTATCVQSFTPPAGYMPDVSCQDKGSLIVEDGPLPLILGADENLNSGVLMDAACSANPYYKTLIVERADAPVFFNNIALAVATNPGMPVPLRSFWSWLLLVTLLSLGALVSLRHYGAMSRK